MFYTWAALLIAVLSNYHLDDGATVVAVIDGQEYLKQAYFYYCLTAIAVAFLALAICCNGDNIIYGVFLSLCIGKVADELSHTTFYGAKEFILDLLVACIAFIMWWKRKCLGAIIRNFVVKMFSK